MPQNNYIEEYVRRCGHAPDYADRIRKRIARSAHTRARMCRRVRGLKAKLVNRKRRVEKIEMQKKIRAHEEKKVRSGKPSKETPLPSYLLDRGETNSAKILSNSIKQKRKEKAGKWLVPLPKVRGVPENELFKVLRSGKRQNKQWKRMVTKVCFVGDGFTRRPPKFERFVRPMALRFKSANVTHPELKATFTLPILGVKKNPSSALYTQLGVITRGTIIEVNVSELGLVTTNGKVVWGKYAQVTNNPENDGCINSVLLV